MRLPSLLRALAFATALITSASALAAVPATVYLTRHAEKMKEGKDPDLTPQGQARARNIAAILRNAGISHVYSTDAARALQTAQPLAAQLGLEVQTYNASQPALLIEKIKSTGGVSLLVGHSNTVPDLVKLLGGAPGPEIDELEFDRLYQLTIGGDGVVRTVLLHSIGQQP